MGEARNPFEKTKGGKILHALRSTEELGTKLLLDPLASSLDPAAYEKIAAMRAAGQPVYGQDVVDKMWPIEGAEQKPWYDPEKLARAATGFVAGAAVDPISYLAPGATRLGEAAGIRAGMEAAAARVVPSKFISLAERLPALAEQAAQRGLAPGEVLNELRALGGREATTSLERKVVEAFWASVPEIPGPMSERLKQGFTSWLRVEVPFTKLQFDARTMLENAHAQGWAQAIDYPVAWTMERMKQAGQAIASRTAVGRIVKGIGMGFDDTFGTSLTRSPALMRLTNRFLENMEGLKGKTAEEIATHFAADNIDLTKDFMREFPGMGLDEAKQKMTAAMRRALETTRWDPASGELKSAFYKAGLKEDGSLAFTKLDPNGQAQIDAALDEMRIRPPGMGGPVSPMDDAFVKGFRQQVVNIHQMHYQQWLKEQDAFNNVPILWASGGYLFHMVDNNVKKVLGSELHKNFRRLPGSSYMSNLMRKWRVVVPAELDAAEQGLRDITIKRGGVKMKLWEEADFKGIREGLMQKDDAFAASIFKKIKMSYRKGALDMEGVTRLVHTFSIDEVNEYVRKFGLLHPKKKGLYLIRPGEVENFFNPRVEELVFSRVVSGDSKIARNQFLTELKQFADEGKVGTKITDYSAIPEGMREVKAFVPLKGYAFPESEARHLENIMRVYGDMDGHVDKFFKSYYDPILRWWKAWTLYPFPVYHVRNFVGNIWNNYLAGVSHGDNMMAWRVRQAIRNGKWEEELFKHPITKEAVTVRRIFEEGRDRALWNSGFMSASVEQEFGQMMNREVARVRRLRRIAKGQKLNPAEWARSEFLPDNESLKLMMTLEPDSPFIQTGARVAGYLEDQAKIAHMVFQLRTGKGWDDAVKLAKVHLGDYRMMGRGPADAWIRRAFPFYQWSKFNIPLQLAYLVKRPYRAMNVMRGIDAVQSLTGINEKDAPSLVSPWFQRAGGVRWRVGKDGRQYIFTGAGWLPLFDLCEGLDLGSWASGNMSPIPRTIIEHLLNVDLMTNRKIDLLTDRVLTGRWITKGERAKLFGMEMPRHLQHFLRTNFRIARTVDDMFWNPEHLDATSNILRTFVGRDYPNNPDRTRAAYFKVIRDWQTRYRNAMHTAQSYKDFKEARRVGRQLPGELKALKEREWTL